MEVQLHKGQRIIFNDPHRFRVVVCGRRFGKSRLQLWELILAALNFPGEASKMSPERVLGALPTLSQAKKILWEPLYNICTQTEVSKYVRSISKVDYRIDFECGKPSIVVAGALDHDGDRLRGMRLYFVSADEVQDWRPTTWDQVITPAMADTPGSRALITGTPKGRQNILYTLAERAKSFPDIYSFHNLPTWVNPTIEAEDVEMARTTLTPRSFRQEFLAEFCDYPGKVYSELEESNLVDSAPQMFDLMVMGVDWGDVHPAFVVMGRLAGTWYYVDGYAPDTGEPVPQPVQDEALLRLAKRYNIRGVYCDPSRPTSIIHIRDLGKQHNIEGLQKAVAGFNRISEGIEQVHSLIFQKKLMFSKDIKTKCPGHIPGHTAYNLMSDYHRKTDKNGTVLEEIAEGQPDHIVDAIRYALAVNKVKH